MPPEVPLDFLEEARSFPSGPLPSNSVFVCAEFGVYRTNGSTKLHDQITDSIIYRWAIIMESHWKYKYGRPHKCTRTYAHAQAHTPTCTHMHACTYMHIYKKKKEKKLVKHLILPSLYQDGHTLPLRDIKLGMELGYHKVGLKDAENLSTEKQIRNFSLLEI